MHLIDGYNLLLRTRPAVELTAAELESWVRQLAAQLGRRCRSTLIIFDAQSRPGGVRRRNIGPLDVVFTPYGQTADEWILESLLAATKPWTVVTSDRTLSDRARELGAKTLTSEGFLLELARRKRPTKIPQTEIISPNYPALSSDEKEIAHFCQIFERRFSDKRWGEAC